MSYQLILNKWSGEDSEEASAKLAKVFRIDKEEAESIVQGLAEGNVWQIEHPISASQSEIAENFLVSLGFEVERVEASFEDVDEDEAAQAEAAGAEQSSFMKKLWGELTKKR